MKKILKLFCFAFCIAFIMTGCATVSNIKNNSDDVLYHGGAVTAIGDYLYFANSIKSYSENLTKNSDYKGLAKTSNLKRVDLNNLSAEDENTSANNVKTVAKEYVGYENTFMFVLGNYIYYSTPNLHKDKGNNNHFDYTTIYRSKLNGSAKKEVYTSTSALSSLRVLKSSKNKYYLVMVDGNSNILKMELGKKIKKAETLVEGASSYAIPDQGQEWNDMIYYTKSSSNSLLSGSLVYAINIEDSANDDLQPIYNGASSSGGVTISFTGRQDNTLFYTSTKNSISETYYLDIDTTSFTTSVMNESNRFYNSASAISNVVKIEGNKLYEGYIFTVDSKIIYKNMRNNNLTNITEELSEEYSDFAYMFVDGTRVFFKSATNNGIYYYDVTSQDVTVVIEMESSLYSGNIYGYDGTNLYYYAQVVVKTDEEETESSDTEEEKDENYYLYMIKVDRNANETYQLLGQVE